MGSKAIQSAERIVRPSKLGENSVPEGGANAMELDWSKLTVAAESRINTRVPVYQ